MTDGAATPVEYVRMNRIGVITINRPERKNAIDGVTARALGAAWRRFFADDQADVAVLTGKGETFCAGADLKAFDLTDHPDGWLGFTRLTSPKPTIAAIEGYCVAGGLELALWCDLRVAGNSATFGCYERRWGVPLVDGGTQRLARIVGLGRGLDIMLTGRAVPADEALAIGLVNRVVPDGSALEAAVALAATIAASPQETLRTDRQAMLEGIGMTLAEGLKREAELGSQVLDVARVGAKEFESGAGRGGDGVPQKDP
jgi:enoyl-CoA hydratase/carnithine racemase